MAITLINTNFSTLNDNLELLRQTKNNQIITQTHNTSYIYNSGSTSIDLWENGVKIYNHIVIMGVIQAYDNYPIVYQESNDNINFFSDGVPIVVKPNPNPGTGGDKFYFTTRNISSRYCRIYSRSYIDIHSLRSIKSSLY
jgi:hypothetical protein